MKHENEKKSQLRVLSLEDSFMDLELIKECLIEDFGHETQIDMVSNEEDYVLALSKGKYDLILSDFNLLGLNGFRALELAKSMVPSIPFICVSGKIGEEVATELLKQGATDYVSKEKLGRLKQSIERALKELKNQNDLKEAHLTLIKSEERYKALTKTSIDGFFILDIKGSLLEVNDVYSKTSGYSEEVLLTMNIKDLESDEFDNQIDEHMKKIINIGYDQFESKHRKRDGTFNYFHNSITFIPTEKVFICFLHDITDRKRTEDELIHLSYYDGLTEVYNRRFYEEELARLDTKRNLPLTIIMADVNGLKLFNDSFGHSVGDEILKKTAQLIKKACRSDDIMARLGGDEFVMVLPKTDPYKATKIVKRLEGLIAKEYFNGLVLSVSFGFETKENVEQKMSEIFANAENRMYRHKIFEHSSMRSETINIIMNTLFEKSKRESLHSKRVSIICKYIALNMNFEKDDVSKIKTAGLIHDIGKIGVDEFILNKPGKLNDFEWSEIKKHPEAGWRILSSAKEFVELADFINEHHEKWDGTGYPKGLKGEEISIEARIITIADTYDAMTSRRAYKKALNKEEAIAELLRCRGTQFDPEIVDVFVNKVLLNSNILTELDEN